MENQNDFLAMLPRGRDNILLDIGCNDGSFTTKIIETTMAKQTYGIEVDVNQANIAIQRGVRVKICDLNKPFPFEDNFFNIITANQVIEHLYNHDNFFGEILRILKKGGIFLISTLNLCAWHNIAFTILGMQPPGMHLCKAQMGNLLYGTETHGHIKLFSPKALRDIAKYYGFTIGKIRGSGYYPFTGSLAFFFSRLDTTHSVYITMSGYK